MDPAVVSSIAAAQRDFAQVLETGELQKWWRALDSNRNRVVTLREVESFVKHRYPVLAHILHFKIDDMVQNKRYGSMDPWIHGSMDPWICCWSCS